MTTAPTLIATRGLPGSGKTTWATEQVTQAAPGTLVRVGRDPIGLMLHGQRFNTGRTEMQITEVQHATIKRFLGDGVSVIADDTNLPAKSLRGLAEIAWLFDVEFRVQDFTDVPLETCIARDAQRPTPVGEQVIRDKHRRYLTGHRLPVPQRPDVVKGLPYVPDPALPYAVIVDIDGTVALHVTRSPYDTSRYHEDAPNRPVIAGVRAMHAAGYNVVFCSGRDAEFRDVTAAWIRQHVGIEPDHLHMRPAGDRRRDDVVKLELFDQHIRNRWNVVACWDDRDRVVAAYRGLGLTVYQVAPGAF